MVLKKIKAIIAEHLGIEEESITLESTMTDDLGADSLDAVEIIMAIEEEFNLEIPDDVVESFVTLQNIVTYVESQIEE